MSSASPEALLLGLLLSSSLAGCEREARRFEDSGSPLSATSVVRQSQLQPGPPTQPVNQKNRFENNAYATSQGKRLYQQFNCSGCHFQGGGGIGPPLMDDEWIYGSEPENIYSTIVEGRPNGMPAFDGKIPPQQVWQLVAYVRSMSGLLAKDVAPGRDDAMMVKGQQP
jgi:cytochrome c oxidase cbb3-type subunit 3